MSQIFAIGTRKIKQASMREDGTWFERYRREGKPGWHKWHVIPDNKRPAFAWYNPQLGNAKLPKDNNNENI